MYRAGEVFLMYAEALLYTGAINEAMTIINSGNSYVEYTPTGTKKYNVASKGVRGRMGLSVVLPVVEDKAIAAGLIRMERSRELIFEGKSWDDLMRYAYSDDRADIIAGDKLINRPNWFIRTK